MYDYYFSVMHKMFLTIHCTLFFSDIKDKVTGQCKYMKILLSYVITCQPNEFTLYLFVVSFDGIDDIVHIAVAVKL